MVLRTSALTFTVKFFPGEGGSGLTLISLIWLRQVSGIRIPMRGIRRGRRTPRQWRVLNNASVKLPERKKEKRLTTISPTPTTHRPHPIIPATHPRQLLSQRRRTPRNQINHALRPCHGRGYSIRESEGCEEESGKTEELHCSLMNSE